MSASTPNSTHTATLHPLLRLYAPVATRMTSVGALPTPYLIHGGHALLIGATGDLAAVQAAIAQEELSPVVTTSGRALLAVWVIQATQASLGAHYELQVSVVVSRAPVAPVVAQPLALIGALANPDVRILCRWLWNDTPPVLAYNDEVLGLAPRALQVEHADTSAETLAARFVEADGAPIVTLRVPMLRRAGTRAVRMLAQVIGWRGVLKAIGKPWESGLVVNPRGEVIVHNADAQTHIAGDPVAFDLWDTATCQLEFTLPELRALDIQPTYLQQFHQLKFVYLNPHNVGDAPLPQVG